MTYIEIPIFASLSFASLSSFDSLTHIFVIAQMKIDSLLKVFPFSQIFPSSVRQSNAGICILFRTHGGTTL